MQFYNPLKSYQSKLALALFSLSIIVSSCNKEVLVKEEATCKGASKTFAYPETILCIIKGENGVELTIKGLGAKVFIYNSKPGFSLGGSKVVSYRIEGRTYGDHFSFDSNTIFEQRTEIPVYGAVRLNKQGKGMVYEETYNFQARLFGVLSASMPVISETRTSGVCMAESYWPKPQGLKRTEIRVKFMETSTDIIPANKIDSIQASIKESAKAWEIPAYIHLKFVSSKEPADIRIALINDPKADFAGNSELGINAKWTAEDEPTMHLNQVLKYSKEFLRELVQHEFGHALGLEHEQNHSKANINLRALTIYYMEVESQDWTDAEVSASAYLPMLLSKYRGLNNPIIEESAYDPLSIMHYDIPLCAMPNGKNITRSSIVEISEGDKAFIGKIYPYPN